MRISDSQVEDHLDGLEKLGPKLAAARADAEYFSDYIKTVYAAEYLRSDLPRVGDKEAEAYASDAYVAALGEKRKATMLAETHRHEKTWRESVIEVWRTLGANERGKI